jgi:hypothetical protein
MELSSQDSIRAVIAFHSISADQQRPRSRRITRWPTDASRVSAQPETRKIRREPTKDLKMKCACGTCVRCLDNARWERIFAEKFADPNYYANRGPRIVSPLTSL